MKRRNEKSKAETDKNCNVEDAGLDIVNEVIEMHGANNSSGNKECDLKENSTGMKTDKEKMI